MLTIGQLAAHAGATARAVRHYHDIGLLPEPSRDGSGYRSYDAADVVRLIRIRTLAEAGVPLARVQALLDATPDAFAAAVAEIDAELRMEVRRLSCSRRRIARLVAGDSLALPRPVVDYLDRLRGVGAPLPVVDAERDAWILVAARWPARIDDFMADKHRQLDDPRTVRFYQLLDSLLADDPDDDALAAAADLLAEMAGDHAGSNDHAKFESELSDAGFVTLLDAFAADAHPVVDRLRELLEERGWTGWSNMRPTTDRHAHGDA